MPSVTHTSNGAWSQVARKKIHSELASFGLSIDFDNLAALRRAVARVLEVPLPETIPEQDALMRRFISGEMRPPLHEFDPLKRKPWDVERFRREWALTLEKLGRRI